MTATVTKPGVYELPEAEYHAHPALSSSGARRLLPPSCPALFEYEREFGRPDTKVFDVGHAAHKLALGIGPEIVELPFDSMRTNAAKDFDAAARAAGKVPLKADDYAVVQAMAGKLRDHPTARALFEPGSGQAEASLFWTDEPSGIERRARLDWLPHNHEGRLIVPDYKTTRSADPAKFTRSAMDFGYHQQAPWYLDGIDALSLGDDPVFVFVVQEKTPPYLVSTIQLDVIAMRIGRILNRRAIDLFAECSSTGHWPGYSDEVVLTSLPTYYERQFEDAL